MIHTRQNGQTLLRRMKARLEERINHWYYEPFPAWGHLLQPAAWCWRVGVEVRLAAFRWRWLESLALDVPVISVGNLSVGGTGKTPIVRSIAEHLIGKGLCVLILSRGFRSQIPVKCQRATDPRFGDEAYLLQRCLPQAVVIVGQNRKANARAAMRAYRPDVVLLDDGFQHLAIARNLDIVLIDGERRFGNGRLTPTGPLREPLGQMRRADVVCITRPCRDELAQIKRLVEINATPGVPILEVAIDVVGLEHAVDGVAVAPRDSAGMSALLVSGISRPDSFEADVNKLGVNVYRHLRYPNHCNYIAHDVDKIIGLRRSRSPIIVTEKDWVKLERLLNDEVRGMVYVLKIRPQLNDLFPLVDTVLQVGR